MSLEEKDINKDYLVGLLQKKKVKEARLFLKKIAQGNEKASFVLIKALEQCLVDKKTTPLGIVSAVFIYKQLLIQAELDLIDSDDFPIKIHRAIYNFSLYSPKESLQTRGMKYFVEEMKQKQTQSLQNLGLTLIRMCLEIFQSMAKAYPQDCFESQPSLFMTYYTKLKQKGVIFPDIKDHFHFKEEDRKKFTKNLQAFLEKLEDEEDNQVDSPENKDKLSSNQNANIEQNNKKKDEQQNSNDKKKNTQKLNDNRTEKILQMQNKKQKASFILSEEKKEVSNQNESLQKEKAKAKELQKNRQKQKQIQLEKQKQKQKQILLQKQKQKQKQKQIEIQKEKEKVKLKQIQMEKQKEKVKQLEKEKQKQLQLQREREREREREKEKEKKQNANEPQFILTTDELKTKFSPRKEQLSPQKKQQQFSRDNQKNLTKRTQKPKEWQSKNYEQDEKQFSRQNNTNNVQNIPRTEKIKEPQLKQYAQENYTSPKRLSRTQKIQQVAQNPKEIRKRSIPKTQKRMTQNLPSQTQQINFFPNHKTNAGNAGNTGKKTLSDFRELKNKKKNQVSENFITNRTEPILSIIDKASLDEVTVPFIAQYFHPINRKMEALILESLKVGEFGKQESSRPFYQNSQLSIRLIKVKGQYILSIHNISNAPIQIGYSQKIQAKYGNQYSMLIKVAGYEKNKPEELLYWKTQSNDFMDIPFKFNTQDPNFRFLQFCLLIRNKVIVLELPITLLDQGQITKSMNNQYIAEFLELHGTNFKTQPFALSPAINSSSLSELPHFFQRNRRKESQLVAYFTYRIQADPYTISNITFLLKQVHGNQQYQVHAIFDRRVEANEDYAKVLLELLYLLLSASH